MRMLFRSVVVAGIAFVLSGCAAAPSATNTSADEAALKAATNAWFEAYNGVNADKAAALYADDAVLTPPHAAVAKGRAAIRAFIATDSAGAKAAGVKLVNVSSTVGVAGDTGWEAGSYTVNDPSGATVDSGSYMSVSRKINGEWLYIRDTYNSDRPLPPPAAPAPAAAK